MTAIANVMSAYVTAAQLLVMILSACVVWLNYNEGLLSHEKGMNVIRVMLVAAVSLIIQSLVGHVVREEYTPGPALSTVIGLLGAAAFVACMWFADCLFVMVATCFLLYFIAIFYKKFEDGEWYYLVALLIILLVGAALYKPLRIVIFEVLLIVECSAMITYGSFDLHRITKSEKSFAEEESTFVSDSFGAETCLSSDQNACKLRLVVFSMIAGFRLVFTTIYWMGNIRDWCHASFSCCCGCDRRAAAAVASTATTGTGTSTGSATAPLLPPPPPPPPPPPQRARIDSTRSVAPAQQQQRSFRFARMKN